MQKILTGDIGGTKTHLAVACLENNGVVLENPKKYINSEFKDPGELLTNYINNYSRNYSNREKTPLTRCSLGVAGPVTNNTVAMTNAQWSIDGSSILNTHGFQEVKIINDLEAMALGIFELKENDFTVIQSGDRENSVLTGAGRQNKQNISVIAAGTGLGISSAVYCKHTNKYHILPSEGGQGGFTPQSRAELQLWEYMLEKNPNAVVESVLSGPGFMEIFKFLLKTGGSGAETARTAQAILQDDNPALAITEKGLQGKGDIYEQTIDMFVQIYASEAANLVLRNLSYGGLFIGGGIAPQLSEKIQSELFLKRFIKKGSMEEALKKVPVYLIQNTLCPLYGAAAALLK